MKQKPETKTEAENTLTREAEDALLVKYTGSASYEAFTRERFLKRILIQEQEEKQKQEFKPLGRTTPEQQAQFEAEQAAGRAAVQKAEGKPQLEQEQAAGRAAVRKAEGK
jgi:hypothetical protein